MKIQNTITYTTKSDNYEAIVQHATNRKLTFKGAARVVAKRLGIKPSQVFVDRIETASV